MTETVSGDGVTDDRSLLIVDDDPPFLNRLATAMERCGFLITVDDSVASGIDGATAHAPRFAVLDLRLGDGSGLDIVPALRKVRPGLRIVMLTGYGNTATAVAVIKAGAVDYLAKPTDADAVEAALLACEDGLPPPPEHPM